MNLTGKPVYQKPEKSGKDPARLAAVGSMRCCICAEYGLSQSSPTQVHHCIHGRHSTSRAPDAMTIPLCEGHHQGMMDISKIAIHREPSRWKKEYGLDTDWLSWVEARL